MQLYPSVIDTFVPNSSVLQGGPGSCFPRMDTEAQGGGDFRDGSLGDLETRRIMSNLKWVRNKSLEQSYSTAATFTFETGSFFAGGSGEGIP